ncbi:MAG: 4Fe-4S binding protein [Deltaproteobacteria bacterium]|nr:4Fe-4S binding protein [Deltaproteobacteria bacterium]
MKMITLMPVIDAQKCKGCKTCIRVCPTLAMKLEEKLAVVDLERCRGCANCEQRCPEYAIVMAPRPEPILAGVDPANLDYEKIRELCLKARFHPEQTLCYCTGTRADEVAGAILLGAKTPEDISCMTGIRTGCKVECIEPVLRLLEAAEIHPTPVPGGWQWYGRTITAWEIPVSVKQKYASRGFYFDEDIEILDRVVSAPLQGKEQ